MVKVGDVVKILLNMKLGLFSVTTLTIPTKYLSCKYITIIPTCFFIDKNKRQRFLNNKEISGHAWVEGIVVDFEKHDKAIEEINYNPYLYDYFFTSKDHKEYNSLENKLNFQYETKKAYITKDSNEKIKSNESTPGQETS